MADANSGSLGVPQLFGPYVLLGEIARGGMADVQFAVHQDDPSRILALKRILPQFAQDANYRRFFAAEAELSRHLVHPRVVRAVDAGEFEKTPFLAMEYVHGRALNRLLYAVGSVGKRLPVPFAIALALQTLDGLEYIHHATDRAGRDLGVVLCDLSPSNILVGYDGQVKLIDFGIATSRVRFSEQIGMLKGKKNYMSPEQLRGLPLDGRSDLFSMGLCVLELLTAQAMFTGKSEFEIEEAVRSGRIPNLAERLAPLPQALEPLIRRALESNPASRYPSARAFAEALTPFSRTGKGEPVRAEGIAKLVRGYLGPAVAKDDARLAEVREGIARAGLARPFGERETEPPQHPAKGKPS